MKSKSAVIIATALILILPLTAYAGNNEWTSLGQYGGYVTSIAFSPNFATNDTVFAGTIYDLNVSTDRGATWTKTADSPYFYYISSVVLSPSFENDSTIFMFQDFGSPYPLLKSSDGGTTWQPFDGSDWNYLQITDLELSPDYLNDQTVIMTNDGENGVLISTDGGGTWNRYDSGVPTSPPTASTSVELSPDYTTDNTMFISTSNGIYKSTNSGANWFSSYSGMPPQYIKDISVSPSYTSDQTVFAISNDSIYRSTDGGQSWSWVYEVGEPYLQNITVSPDYSSDNTVFAVDRYIGLLMSTDGGDNWSTAYPVPGLMFVAPSPDLASDGTIFVGHGALIQCGIHKSDDWGTTWSWANEGIELLSVLSLATCPDTASASTIFVSYIGTNRAFKSDNGGADWSSVFQTTIDREATLIAMSPSYSTDQTVYLVKADNTSTFESMLYKSVDGGQNWTYANLTLGYNITSPGQDGIRSLALSPNYANDQTVIAGGYAGGIYKSTDGGGSWNNTHTTTYSVEELAFSPEYTSDQTVFFGDDYGNVFKSTDSGNNWNLARAGNTNCSVTGLAVSPGYANDRTVVATVKNDGTFLSTDGGGTWIEVSTLSAYALDMSPCYPNDHTMVIGYSTGYKKTSDGGLSWQEFSNASNGTPWQTVRICFSSDYQNDMTIYSGTRYNSVWAITSDPPVGEPELTHYDWDSWLTGSDCAACHHNVQTFLAGDFLDSEGMCYSCHNTASNAHGRSLITKGHGVMSNITSPGIATPTYGNLTGEFDNRPYANLPGGMVTCVTCHNAMQKSEDVGRVWELTTTSDDLTYTMQNGAWDASGYYKPKVYRDTSFWIGPSNVSDKKAYLVDESEYTYDESAGTVTFRSAQDPAAYIYVTLYYPYLRAGTIGNRLCSDCHPEETHQGRNCMVKA